MNDKFKKVLFELMDSHSKLASAEYHKDTTFNSSHFAYKAEESILDYFRENEPKILDEYFTKDK